MAKSTVMHTNNPTQCQALANTIEGRLDVNEQAQKIVRHRAWVMRNLELDARVLVMDKAADQAAWGHVVGMSTDETVILLDEQLGFFKAGEEIRARSENIYKSHSENWCVRFQIPQL